MADSASDSSTDDSFATAQEFERLQLTLTNSTINPALDSLDVEFSRDDANLVPAKENVWWSRKYLESTHPELFTRAINTRRRLMVDLGETFKKLSKSKLKRFIRRPKLTYDLFIEDRFELRMTGRAAKTDTIISLWPCVWVRCDDKYSERKVQKRLKELEYLKSPTYSDIHFCGPVIPGHRRLEVFLEGLDMTQGIDFPTGEWLHLHIAEPATSYLASPFNCGLLCCATVTRDSTILDQRLSRFGGVLRMNDSIDTVTTTAHGMLTYFLAQEWSKPLEDDSNHELASSQSSDGNFSDSDEESDPDLPLESRAHEDEFKLGYVNLAESITWQATVPIDSINFIGQAKEPVKFMDSWEFIATGFDTDYALCKLRLPDEGNGGGYNSYKPENDLEDSLHSSLFVDGHMDLELSDTSNVDILLGFGLGGTVSARLISGEVPVCLHGMRFLTRKLLLHKPLAEGTSGAWVVVDRLFCGMIIALFQGEPYALMLSAATVFSDMRRFGSNLTSISLPTIPKPSDPSPPEQPSASETSENTSTISRQPIPPPKATSDLIELAFAGTAGLAASFRQLPLTSQMSENTPTINQQLVPTLMPTGGMSRIVIAGGGGFANILIQELSHGSNTILVLSTTPHPELEAEYDCQVAVVDYANTQTLRSTLQGVDLVISTISGPEQLNLIDAASQARVRCFVPSEFEGALAHRPEDPDPINRGSSTALDLLRRLSSSKSRPMRFTVFTCGVFYERFAPGGLAAYNVGASFHIQEQGDYMVNIGEGVAEIPQTNAQGRAIRISMTSMLDVARSVASAIELGIDNWPQEFKMRGAAITPQRLVEICQEVRGVQFSVVSRPYSELRDWLRYCEEAQDWTRWYQVLHLIQTADGRYSFGGPFLNDEVNFRPIGLRTWLKQTWGTAGFDTGTLVTEP